MMQRSAEKLVSCTPMILSKPSLCPCLLSSLTFAAIYYKTLFLLRAKQVIYRHLEFPPHVEMVTRVKRRHFLVNILP